MLTFNAYVKLTANVYNDKTMMYMNSLYTCLGLTEPCCFVTHGSRRCLLFLSTMTDHSQNSLSLKVHFLLLGIKKGETKKNHVVGLRCTADHSRHAW